MGGELSNINRAGCGENGDSLEPVAATRAAGEGHQRVRDAVGTAVAVAFGLGLIALVFAGAAAGVIWMFRAVL